MLKAEMTQSVFGVWGGVGCGGLFSLAPHNVLGTIDRPNKAVQTRFFSSAVSIPTPRPVLFFSQLTLTNQSNKYKRNRRPVLNISRISRSTTPKPTLDWFISNRLFAHCDLKSPPKKVCGVFEEVLRHSFRLYRFSV